jgi:acetyl-CoA carboxylase biotin carboxyl carrier protein
LDLEQLKQLLDLVREHEFSEFEIEHDGLRVRIRKDAAGGAAVALPAHPAASAAAASAPAAVAGAGMNAALAAAPVIDETAGDTEIELAVVKSPIVGTFYRSPEPGAASFVEIGSTVKKGEVLCIIEAMKLMNEIEAEVAGIITAKLVENGRPVEYGEALFSIRPR